MARQNTRALKLLVDARVDHTTHSFPVVAHDVGRAAADHLGVDPSLLLKTLIVDLSGRLGVCCVPATTQLSLKKAARAFGVGHAEMAEPRIAERATGYVTGGISPLAQRTALPTLIDVSVADAVQIYVSAGKKGLDVCLSPADLARLSGAEFVDLQR